MTRPDGTIVAIGGDAAQRGVRLRHDDVDRAAADTPGGYATVDGPGATLPNGDVIFATGPCTGRRDTGDFSPGTQFYEISGTTFTQVGGTTDDARASSSYQNFLLVLPTGELLHTQDQLRPGTTSSSTRPPPGVAANAVPEILGEPELVGIGDGAADRPHAHDVQGPLLHLPIARMNGIDLGADYGDDVQVSTDFPIVRVTASDSGHVWYCRTYDRERSVDQPRRARHRDLRHPATVEGGTAEITVIANGIASRAAHRQRQVTVRSNSGRASASKAAMV